MSGPYHNAGSPDGAGPLTTVAESSVTLPHGIGPATDTEAVVPDMETVSVRSEGG